MTHTFQPIFQNITKKLIPLCFLLILALGLFGSLSQPDVAFSNTENRYLAQAPTFSLSGLMDGSYTSSLEDYLNDQFIGRDGWIHGKTLGEKDIFQKKVIHDVCIGSDSYLLNQYTEKDVDAMQISKNINYLNQFQDNYQADVLLIPSASEILTNRLTSSLDQLDFDALLADTRPTLSADQILSAHQEEPIYYKTDHHWTLLGAYYVYDAYMKHAVSYNPVVVSQNFQGTTARQIGVTDINDEIWQQKSDSVYEVIYDNRPETLTDSLYVPTFLEKTDQYSYFLDGNHGLTEIRNLTLASQNSEVQNTEALSSDSSESSVMPQSSILLIKDSYGNSFAPLLSENFETVYMIDLRYYNGSVSAFIKEHDIQNVLFLYSKVHFMQDKNLSKLLR